ncbi:hypothetical protein BZG35_16515 [Brevundimonas sp. LM2]|uniref:hypothetical protein n=1 Tax=Brevundimonas sp. LM2 TaxID=1938605 RepID=UPI000983FBC7|nr:hypothetical protein [Brevundimonas sp. LM2]AQR63079.1 hypothetical protein BZG35_16515 [Brevundimonas sp. LM2]
MRMLLFAAAMALSTPAVADPATTAPAEVLRRIPAEEARQGVAVDADHLYAIDNSRIGKYDRASGRRMAAWSGDPALIPHLNSCSVVERQLVCASSNYPATPMTSSVEVFDLETLTHSGSVSLGPGTGSLTWVERHDGFWWATFANYDGRGGDTGRDHRSTVLVKFDDDWHRLEAWLFPETVLAWFAPYSSSGGVWGDDDRLYVTGHDEQELYVLALPEAGGRLIHVATIPVAARGQAVSWGGDRTVWGIDRSTLELIEMRLPLVITP